VPTYVAFGKGENVKMKQPWFMCRIMAVYL